MNLYKSILIAMLHMKCRGQLYPRTGDNQITRFPVPDDKVSWSIPFPDYDPIEYTANSILKQPIWADADKPIDVKWNCEDDGNVNRVSYTGEYKIDTDTGRPLNPCGRTGLKGRGCLGRWGPNHAADPIVTRWKKDKDGKILIDDVTHCPILQFVAILRGDCGEWAIPGGMVDPGEKFSKTLQREFFEEALAADTTQTQLIKSFFEQNNGSEVYRGYVDDPRNTDNAWMETVAFNFHDEKGDVFDGVTLKAGDDAVGVTWSDVAHNLKLYASHVEFLKKVAHVLKAHW